MLATRVFRPAFDLRSRRFCAGRAVSFLFGFWLFEFPIARLSLSFLPLRSSLPSHSPDQRQQKA